MLGIEFPKDFKGNDSIRNNWIADMKHFCKTFQPPKGKFQTEQLIIYPLSEDRYIQGYIDLIRENDDEPFQSTIGKHQQTLRLLICCITGGNLFSMLLQKRQMDIQCVMCHGLC